MVRYVCGLLSIVSHCTAGGVIVYPVGAQPSAALVTSAAMSGMPVALPAESAQLVMSSGVCRSNVPVPTSAKSSEHALMMALRVSFGFRCESMKSTWTLRPPIPPLAFTYLPHPWTPSTMPFRTPGAKVLSTSAMTATLTVLASTPTSVLPLAWALAGTPISAVPRTTMTATTPVTDDLRMTFSPSSSWPGS